MGMGMPMASMMPALCQMTCVMIAEGMKCSDVAAMLSYCGL